jgi:protoporphyrinogen oxidase
LPDLLAGWDVCLMPFAINEATKFISPTKVLEYMAAQLPIVSTPIADVANPYGHVVAIANGAREFVAACEAALAQTPEQRQHMREAMKAVVAATSWDNTATRMHELLESTSARSEGTAALRAVSSHAASSASLQTNLQPAEQAAVQPAPQTGTAALKVNPLRSQGARHVGTVIVGGGPTGLSAAYHLGADTLLLDRNDTVGGWCRSIEDKGFTFDHAGHIMFSNDPYVLKMYEVLLGDNVHWQNREAWIYSKNVYTRYPFQGALYGLPPKVITECVMGAIEARYGADGDAGAGVGALEARAVDDCCGDGTTDVCNTDRAVKGQVNNFEQFIYKVWGKGIAKHFAIPYNRKIWTVPLADMETSWLGGRVPLPNLEEIVQGALEPSPRPVGPNARFGYPLKGGFQALMNGFLPHIKGKIELGAEVVQVLPREHIVALADGRRFRYDDLISTMPLPELIKAIGEEAPDEVRNAAKGLRHVSIRCVNIGIDRVATDKHWIYYPEDTIFHRIFVQGNASPECNPPGGFGFTCEISYSPSKPLPLDGNELIAQAIEDCRRVGMIREGDRILVANQVDMPYAYVLYDHQRARNVETCKAWLKQFDITLVGRYSEWEYYNSDHALLAGKRGAEAVLAKRSRAQKVGSE